MPYMVTFTITIPPMLAYIPYMDPMGIYIYMYSIYSCMCVCIHNMHKDIYSCVQSMCLVRGRVTTEN